MGLVPFCAGQCLDAALQSTSHRSPGLIEIKKILKEIQSKFIKEFKEFSSFSFKEAFHFSEAGSKEWDQLTRATRGRVEGLQRGLQTKLTSSQDQAL